MTRFLKRIFVALSLAGTLLVAFKHPVLAQAVWIAPNIGLAALNFKAGDLEQGILFLAFLAVALFGLANWLVTWAKNPARRPLAPPTHGSTRPVAELPSNKRLLKADLNMDAVKRIQCPELGEKVWMEFEARQAKICPSRRGCRSWNQLKLKELRARKIRK